MLPPAGRSTAHRQRRPRAGGTGAGEFDAGSYRSRGSSPDQDRSEDFPPVAGG
jgi:hypothetical protein